MVKFAPPLGQGYTRGEVGVAMKLLINGIIALIGLFAAVSCSHLMTNDKDVLLWIVFAINALVTAWTAWTAWTASDCSRH